MIYWTLFFTFFRIGLFSFGGGYAMLSMIQTETVTHYHWLSQYELTDMIAISQMTPGPIAINLATFIGYRQAGIWGSILTTTGVILPSLILMSLITLLYFKLKKAGWFVSIMQSLRPLVIGLIASAAWLAGKNAVNDLFGILVFTACFLLAMLWKVHPILLMLLSGIAGILLT